MPSLVDEMQAQAADSHVPIADLLRRVKIAATKLGLAETERWVDLELNGYYGAEIPDYRAISHQIVYSNLVHGWQPLILDSESFKFMHEPRMIPNPIRELEGFATGNDAVIYIGIDPTLQKVLLNNGVPGEVKTRSSRNSFSAIIDAVRTRVLDWALEMDRTGIRGDGMSFTPDEKRLAQQIPQITFNGNTNITGHVGASSGTVHTANVSQTSTSSVQNKYTQLAAALRDASEGASPEDAPFLRHVADDIDDATKVEPVDEPRLKRIVALAKNVVPRLAAFTGKAALEHGIDMLMNGTIK